MRSKRALAQLRALSEQLHGRGQRGQLKHAHNDHARMLRLLVACSRVAGGGRWVAWDGAMKTRAARRALAHAAAVRARRRRAGKVLQAMTWSVIAVLRSLVTRATWHGLQYTLHK